MSDGWVRIYHPDQVDEPPNPDNPDDANKFALATSEAFRDVWEPRGFVDLDATRDASASDNMPEKAADRIKWIDSPQDVHVRVARARAALEDEEAREAEARTTVISHAEDVILTSEEDETDVTDTDPEG
jgi:hypothetical protein